MYGEIIRVTQNTRYTAGMSKASREVSDVWSRSVYGQVNSLKEWECFESDALCTDDMITKIALGKDVSLLVECYAPKGPDAVTKVDTEDDEGPIISVRGDDGDTKPSVLDEDEDHEDFLDKVRLATGAARVSKSSGFGKQRNT